METLKSYKNKNSAIADRWMRDCGFNSQAEIDAFQDAREASGEGNRLRAEQKKRDEKNAKTNEKRRAATLAKKAAEWDNAPAEIKESRISRGLTRDRWIGA